MCIYIYIYICMAYLKYTYSITYIVYRLPDWSKAALESAAASTLPAPGGDDDDENINSL